MSTFNLLEVNGVKSAVHGARSAWNSWDGSDTTHFDINGTPNLGTKDLALLRNLAQAGDYID